MLNYVTGDLFNHVGENYVIAHCCNNIYRMGSGFALNLIKKYPNVYEVYKQEKPPIGKAQIVNVDKNIYVANMVAQNGVIGPNNLKPIKYRHLANCMQEVYIFSKENNLNIVAPLFGSKLAGGNWLFIEELIKEIWHNIDVTIYQLPGEQVR